MTEDFEILEVHENPLFKRKEIIFSMESPVSPNKNEIKGIVAEKFSTIPETVKIKKIKGNFGSSSFKVRANVYETKEDLDYVEIKSKKEIEKEKKVEVQELKNAEK